MCDGKIQGKNVFRRRKNRILPLRLVTTGIHKSLIFSTLKESTLTMYVGMGDKIGKIQVVLFPCTADVRHKHTQTHTLLRTHSHSHKLTHARTHVHNVHTHTRTPHQPAPQLTPAPTTSQQRKKAKKCVSCRSLTALPTGACSRCRRRRRTLLKRAKMWRAPR